MRTLLSVNPETTRVAPDFGELSRAASRRCDSRQSQISNLKSQISNLQSSRRLPLRDRCDSRVLGCTLKTVVIALLAAGLAGCGEFPSKKFSKESQAHWSQVRGQMKLQLAEEHLRAGRLTEAEAQLAESLRLDPKSTPAHILAARVSLEKGELAAARTALDRAIQLGGPTHETDYLLGVLAEWNGDFEKALDLFRQAADRGGPGPAYVVAQAEALVALGRAPEALDLIGQRGADFAGDKAVCVLAGDVHTMLGQYQEASDAYREAAQQDPADWQTRMQLGTSLVRAGRYEEAIRMLAALRDRRKDLPWLARQALGQAYLGRGNAAAAREVFAEASKRWPDNADSWTWQARAALQQGDLAAARQSAEKACELDPSAAHLLLGYICLRQGDLPHARSSLESVLNADPEDWLAHYLLGRALASAGADAEAALHYRQAMKARPDQPWVRQLLATADVPPQP